MLQPEAIREIERILSAGHTAEVKPGKDGPVVVETVRRVKYRTSP